MPTREEIREGILKVIGDLYYEKYGKDMVHTEQDDEFMERLFNFLHSQGVVIKVDNQTLWYIEASEAYKQGQKDLLEAGYVAWKPLIKEEG